MCPCKLNSTKTHAAHSLLIWSQERLNQVSLTAVGMIDIPVYSSQKHASIILDSEPVECTDWNQRDMLITSCYYYRARCCNVHWMTEGKCPLWLSWTVRLTSTPGSTWQNCQTATHRPWLTRLCARSAAGAWLGSPATLSPQNWGLWMWTSLSTAGSTTISGSQRTWSAPAPPWVEKTPVRCVRLCLCWNRD